MVSPICQYVNCYFLGNIFVGTACAYLRISIQVLFFEIINRLLSALGLTPGRMPKFLYCGCEWLPMIAKMLSLVKKGEVVPMLN
jgi:hypothetical protein